MPDAGQSEEFLLPFEKENLRGEYRNYFYQKRNNYFGSIQQFPQIWESFLFLDEIWKRDFDDIKPLTKANHLLPVQMFMNSHAQFRVGFELAFSTCIGEAWNIIRSAIDSAVFAHKVYREPQLMMVWLKKNDGPRQKKEYKRAFETNKRQSLFPASYGLDKLYDYYSQFSELGTHPSMNALALRHRMEETTTGINWIHNYLEADPKRLASFLFSTLSAACLIEQALFNCFKDRLDLDHNLVEMRNRFFEGKRRCARSLIEQFRFVPPPIWTF